MKTAMQKLITNLETMGITFPQGIEQTFLSIEKEQIIEAYEAAMERPIENYAESYYNMNYNQTYNQNES
jgi:hypothetical protein